ncbi:MAG: acyltransferase domain-containing protein, partial [Deltaproteobacteria bacterium]|nr:acyltransferase domain-containing protein [Deltaproteobacteria bacterium]
MSSTQSNSCPIAIVGMGAVMPDAGDLPTFWSHITNGTDSIREVPPERWLIEDHYDPDPRAPDKTYTKIGAFVTGFQFDSLGFRIPPRTAQAMDSVQQWALVACKEALADAGLLDRDFDRERTAVIIGNALAGDMHALTTLRVQLPRFVRALRSTEIFSGLPAGGQEALLEQFRKMALADLPAITEDSMPGELSNVIAGRVANAFGLRGPNFTTDAACASSLAAVQAAAAGLAERRFDLVLTGGVDSSLSPQIFVKFCKIGALSADLSCPFDRRASGFVMGEGCGILLMKRLEDALAADDRIYAVLRSLGSASDGRGKGITAPNPIGQRLAVERAWEMAGLQPSEAGLIEAHGTSTAVGDAVEAKVVSEIFAEAPPASIPMGSVKSQIGHLKSAAGAAALIKAALAIHHEMIPPSIHFEQANPQIAPDAPFYVPREARDWKPAPGRHRYAGVSSFGFGGTNFHVVLGPAEQASRPSVLVEQPTETAQEGPGVLALGADSAAELAQALESGPPREASGNGAERLAIAYSDEVQLRKRAALALSALRRDEAPIWRPLASQGIFRGRGPAARTAFLFPGQGSQRIGMLAAFASEPAVAETFAEADRVMEPVLGVPLSRFIYTEDSAESRAALQDTTVCQPAMLTADIAMLRLLAERGIQPDMVAGHSLGEYAALVAAGMISLADALTAVCARAREMASVQVEDPGRMAAVFGPAEQIQQMLHEAPGVVAANYNSLSQTVIGGATRPMEQAVEQLTRAGFKAVRLPVSHAFHTHIVAPARDPLRRLLGRLDFHPPCIPIVANVDAELYSGEPADRESNLDRLARQVAEPVRFVESIRRLYELGARLFVEVGPGRVLSRFVLDVIEDPECIAVSTNLPKQGDRDSFAIALAACAACGLPRLAEEAPAKPCTCVQAAVIEDAGVVDMSPAIVPAPEASQRPAVLVSGVGLGLPGRDHPVFDPENTTRILDGFVGIDTLSEASRRGLAAQGIARLVKDAPGGPGFELLDSPESVAQLAGQRGPFDPVAQFGLPRERVESWDVSTSLAVCAGLLALRDAGIPLVQCHQITRSGRRIPSGWKLPAGIADETGVIFASAFPGYDSLLAELDQRHQLDLHARALDELRAIADQIGPLHALRERIEALEREIGEGYRFDRRFIFKSLAMGHAQLAELIGARGPNAQVNAACASTTLAVSMAADWIASGRCPRVIVIGADDITNPTLCPWLVGGMLATGAVTTEPALEKAALPFDRRRNGMIAGMGAVGLVVERADSVRERGQNALARLLGSQVANSAFHGTRLDPEHIASVLERLVAQAEAEHGLDRRRLAAQTVFVSHETYTPARGGSASAEVHALRHVFGDEAGKIVIANTKGFTGHAMGVSIEDAAAVRMLQHQRVPPVPNFQQADPELGELELSRGGARDVRYALRLAAGFGSQIAISLFERVDDPGQIDTAQQRRWLDELAGKGARLEVDHECLRARVDGSVQEDEVRQEPAPAAEARVEPEAPAAVAPRLDAAAIGVRV